MGGTCPSPPQYAHVDVFKIEKHNLNQDESSQTEFSSTHLELDKSDRYAWILNENSNT